jgi:hypothetical protein
METKHSIITYWYMAALHTRLVVERLFRSCQGQHRSLRPSPLA